MSMKNMLELGTSPFPCIMPVLPCPLPNEVVKGKQFVLVDLLKSLPRGSFQAEAALEPLFWPDHLPLAV